MSSGLDQPLRPLALFGGTFDPVHYGHLRCADEARRKLGLEAIYLLPSGEPPHRAQPLATASQRLDMLRLAVAGFSGLRIDDREIRRDGPSYMVDTLEEVRETLPGRPLLMLIGQDVANQLHGWHRWKDLFGLTHIVIMTRPDSRARYQREVRQQIQSRTFADVQTLISANAGGVLNVDVSAIDISASAIGNTIRQGRSARAMLPDSVLDYIAHHGLYSQR